MVILTVKIIVVITMSCSSLACDVYAGLCIVVTAFLFDNKRMLYGSATDILLSSHAFLIWLLEHLSVAVCARSTSTAKLKTEVQWDLH